MQEVRKQLLKGALLQLQLQGLLADELLHVQACFYQAEFEVSQSPHEWGVDVL